MLQNVDVGKRTLEAYRGIAPDAILDERTRQLVKLAIAVGGRLEGAVRSHTWQAKERGISEAELDHVVLLSLATIGLSSMVAARSWVKAALATP